MMTKKKVEVSLLGQRFHVKTQRDEIYIQNLAKDLTRQIEDLREQTKAVSTHHIALLLALNLADQLHTQKEQLEQLQVTIKERTNAALNDVKEALSELSPHDGA
jgi:cell division protein ZapA (FtsZ GTPase activity inhibitor)